MPAGIHKSLIFHEIVIIKFVSTRKLILYKVIINVYNFTERKMDKKARNYKYLAIFFKL